MKTIDIDSLDHPLYGEFAKLYASSFPVFEQRTDAQQAAAFAAPSYRLTAWVEGETFIGFVAWWEFETYVYIEHFAVEGSLRGKGYGRAVLSEFISEVGKIVVLEIDPIVDQVSEGRLRFYIKCGLVSNSYSHTHPAYREGCAAHSLVVLSSERGLLAAEYEEFRNDLQGVIMKEGN